MFFASFTVSIVAKNRQFLKIPKRTCSTIALKHKTRKRRISEEIRLKFDFLITSPVIYLCYVAGYVVIAILLVGNSEGVHCARCYY